MALKNVQNVIQMAPKSLLSLKNHKNCPVAEGLASSSWGVPSKAPSVVRLNATVCSVSHLINNFSTQKICNFGAKSPHPFAKS